MGTNSMQLLYKEVSHYSNFFVSDLVISHYVFVIEISHVYSNLNKQKK